MFGVGTTRACTSIATVDDDIYEEDETFSVSLSSTSGSVVINLSSVTVQIIDNDGESISQYRAVFNVICIIL